MTSVLYAVYMKGSLQLEIEDLTQQLGNAQERVAVATRDNNAADLAAWSAIVTATATELAAAQAQYTSRFPGTGGVNDARVGP